MHGKFALHIRTQIWWQSVIDVFHINVVGLTLAVRKHLRVEHGHGKRLRMELIIRMPVSTRSRNTYLLAIFGNVRRYKDFGVVRVVIVLLQIDLRLAKHSRESYIFRLRQALISKHHQLVLVNELFDFFSLGWVDSLGIYISEFCANGAIASKIDDHDAGRLLLRVLNQARRGLCGYG